MVLCMYVKKVDEKAESLLENRLANNDFVKVVKW